MQLSTALKIVVIEDQKLFRDMLVLTCTNVMPEAAAEGAGTGAEGVSLCRKSKPELVFLDLALPDGDGLEFIGAIEAAAPAVRIIALTSHSDEYTIHRALKAKVHGFVDKNEQPLEILKEAVATVMEGGRYLSPAAQRLHLAMVNDPSDFTKILSDKEQVLVGLFGSGLTNEQIAKKMGLSPNTIKVHRLNIMSKLDIHSGQQLVLYAMEKGFVRLTQRRAQPAAATGR